nr:hypothetical protein [Acetobacter malorum]
MIEGQVINLKSTDVMLADIAEEADEVIGVRWLRHNTIMQSLTKLNITACMPSKKNRKSKPSYN